MESGSSVSDPEIAQLLRRTLQRYDEVQAEFETRAQLHPGPTMYAETWRGYFESVRRLFQ
jgi:hypothetical protein